MSKEGTELMGLPETAAIPMRQAFDTLAEQLDAGLRVMELPRQITPGVIAKNVQEVLWQVDNRLDPVHEVGSLDGVILAIIQGRTAFDGAHGVGSAGAVCQSADGRVGYGTPGGSCGACPLAKADYKPASDEPRCGTRIWVVMQIEGELLPTIILVPPTSIDPVREYAKALLGKKALRPWQVVTSLGLRSYTTANGRTVAQIVPRALRLNDTLGIEKGKALNEKIQADFLDTIVAGHEMTSV